LPEPNTRIGRYRPDMLWPDRRLVVELDGKRAHSTAAQLGADARRQAELERRGYTVIRFVQQQVFHAADAVADEVARLLGQGQGTREL
jgi:very-short-patch-repair endonuclease